MGAGRYFEMSEMGYVTMTPKGQKPLKLGQIKEAEGTQYFFMQTLLTPMGYGVYLELIKMLSINDYIILCLSNEYEKEFKQLKVSEVLELGKLQMSPNYKGSKKRIWVRREEWDDLKVDLESLSLKVPKTFGFRTGEKKASHTSISR
jgi:hypothetical protein